MNLSDSLKAQLMALEAIEMCRTRLPTYLHETLPEPTPEPLPKMILLPPLSLTHRLHRALARLFGGE